MMQTDNLLMRPSRLFAVLNVIPLWLLAITLTGLAWSVSPYFMLPAIVIVATGLYRVLYLRSYYYLITTEYIRVSRGLLFKRTDQVEMFRIKDYIITQSFGLQISKKMCLTLMSTDPENPIIQIRGIPESDITDTIRDRVLQARRNNNIIELN